MAGRKPVTQEVRALIFRMAAENRTGGAPHIHGELLKLGLDVSEPTVLRWLRRAPRNPDPAKRWLTFLRNHREAIAAMDFFSVPTLTFNLLYVFFLGGASSTSTSRPIPPILENSFQRALFERMLNCGELQPTVPPCVQKML